MPGSRRGRTYQAEWEYDPNHPDNLDIAPSWDRVKSQAHHAPAGSREDESAIASTSELVAEDRWQQDSAEDIEQWGIAGRIWEAAYLFKLYLCPPRESVEFDPPCPLFAPHEEIRSKIEGSANAALRILELGSGAGYVGLSCAQELDRYRRSREASGSQSRRNDRLVLTDLENVVPLMIRNARLAGFSDACSNGGNTEAATSRSSFVDVLVRPLPWGSAPHAASILQKELYQQPLDYILCSDLVYFPYLLPPLLRSLLDLTDPSAAASHIPSQCPETAAPSRPVVLMAYKIRSYAKEEAFWSALGVWFDVEIVSCRYSWPLESPPSQAKGDIVGQRQDMREKRREGAWHRFGEDAEWEEEQESSDDAYFLFAARRKPSTLAYKAPEDDIKLMDGFMAVSRTHDSRGDTADQEELVRGEGGADFIEWALMGSMDMT
ncbi:hypothetical protein BCV69DRAFT_244553 [Microstroma glucosiphilum]|uniref:Uncharacterized protein n=1 Tax=Pseudomicrostroma glucosiphilum TaxID=1684307 RepID=A0A316UFB8_9BASI|nr:hypothetical protein BCV69DRAFT_244553 [Pseudomicrostroma glucosiphilum]PWN23628.1 hypothetical protein BCV69DRAFT_244553 [Pseudomicrostroma glucosiphilum]